MRSDAAARDEVLNQSSDFAGFNAFRGDPLLQRLTRHLAGDTIAELERHGEYTGSGAAQELARLANTEVPRLRLFDAKGRRLDMVEYHPAYHALMRRSAAAGLHSSLWTGEGAADQKHLARAARFYMTAGVECGHLCPLTMTSASVAALAVEPGLHELWLPRIATRSYDPNPLPPMQKTALTLGMGMTEKQGGTDVRANTTTAAESGDGTWRLSGHKWFMSAPMSDAFLVLAQVEGEPTCFLLPRRLPDGELNGLHLLRLKDKLGNRSNASAEVEFHSALAWRVGEVGRGIRTILEMVTLTRLDCAMASAGLMRGALAEAVHHCRERKVFGKFLVRQPQMTRVLADMALDVAGATALAFRLARSFDRAVGDDGDAAWSRLMTPVTKYWVCKTAPSLAYEAMECLGGNGYVEEGRLARAYREAPVNAIWEGSGNVMALDVARVVRRHPEAVEQVLADIAQSLGEGGTGVVEALRTAVAGAQDGGARLLTEKLALAAAAAELRRLNLGAVAEAFLDSRLHGAWHSTYGMLDRRHDAGALLDALYPPIR